MYCNSMCSVYNSKIWELLIPSSLYLKDLCISYDKTSLFIVTFVRIIIYWILYRLFLGYLEGTQIISSISFVMVIIISLNMISLLIVLIKKPKHEKNFIKPQNIV